MKKTWYIILLIISILAVFVGIFGYINQEKLIERFIQRQSDISNFNYDLLTADSTIKLVTIGTSGALLSDRAQTCNAVFVAGKFFLFDLGSGTSRKLELLKLPLDSLSGIFITHWHSDHYIDLAAVVNRSWFLGRNSKLDIYGPDPIKEIIDGMNIFLNYNTTSDAAFYGPTIFDANHAIPITNVIRLSENKSTIVFDRDGVRITAFETKHQPGYISLGYKITYQDKSLVISGDSTPDDALVEIARDADILLSEAHQADFLERSAVLKEDNGLSRSANITRRYTQYHSSTLDAARIAQKASVKKLILTHLAPPPENPVSRRFYISGMDDIYAGSIILAEDGDVFTIE